MPSGWFCGRPPWGHTPAHHVVAAGVTEGANVPRQLGGVGRDAYRFHYDKAGGRK